MMNKSIQLLLTVTTIWVASVTLVAQASDNANTSATPSSDTNAAVNSESGDEKNAAQLEVVLAIEADEEYGAYLGGECLTCHTPSGGGGSIPLIHAKSKDYLASALLEYKNLQRSSEVMRGVTVALSNEEIAALAAYFSKQ